MPRKIAANSYLLFIGEAGGSEYLNIVCLTNYNISMTIETVDAGSQCGPASFTGELSANIPFSGFTLLDPVTGEISAPDIFEIAKNKTVFNWKIGPAVPVPGDMVKTGLGYFSAYNENYDEGKFGAFGGTITVSGDVVQSITISTLALKSEGNVSALAWAFYLEGEPIEGDIVTVDYEISLVAAGPHVPFTISSTALAGWTTEDIIDDLLFQANVNSPGNVFKLTDIDGDFGLELDGADFADGATTIIHA